MKHAFLLSTVVLAGLLATPAHAADRASLDCMATELGPVEIAKYQHIVGDTLVADGTRQDAALAPVMAVVDTCKKKHGWSDAATHVASAILFARLARPAVEAALTSDGVSIATVERVYSGLPEAVRRDFTTPQASDASGVAAAQALIAARVDTSGRRARLIGMLIASLGIEEFWTARFAAA
ncbi:MAG: hypothetical protein E7773_06685 [Sphingomonas sp.]|uniref:hypothetical protein n=1 Tax=Sphingomonas sp. TaxID=28214 RepID=UPI0012218136|nr:hypothetical protein [Sphingomonas sp.]THD36683.1 MAG: hypothetical protein E7773_06685 [Sphingomonas sp.]